MVTIEIIDVEGFPRELDDVLIPVKNIECLKNLANIYGEPCLLRYREDVYLIIRGSNLIFYHHERAGD